jgi:hypothetical protein
MSSSFSLADTSDFERFPLDSVQAMKSDNRQGRIYTRKGRNAT